MQRSRGYLIQKPNYNSFCYKFCCHVNQEGARVNINDAIRLAGPENRTLYHKNYDSILYTAVDVGVEFLTFP